jgi:hypothetical protein
MDRKELRAEINRALLIVGGAVFAMVAAVAIFLFVQYQKDQEEQRWKGVSEILERSRAEALMNAADAGGAP